MKKIFSAIISSPLKGRLCGLLFALLATTTTLWAYDFQSGDLYYNITSDTTVKVTYQYQTSDNYAGLTIATIPETITHNGNTYSVTSIGDRAFHNCSSLTTVTIPESVTSIGYQAFLDCSSLTSITIPNSVTSIGDWAFYGCSSLTSITIPNSVTSIGDRAFSGCSSLTSITIPNSVTSIGDYAFYGCSSLTSITIPNSVTSIGDSAFYGCSSLTSIIIPNSVTSIGDDAFAETPWYNNISDGVIYLGKVLYKYKGTMPANTSITIEDGTVSISSYAFDGCSSLTSVTIPNSVTSIGSHAFNGCSSLSSITIPNSVSAMNRNTGQITPAIQTQAENVLSVLDIPALKISSVNVVMSREKNRFQVSLVVNCKYHTLKAEVEDFDLYRALDAAADKVEGQCQGLKEKIRVKRIFFAYPIEKHIFL